MNDELKTRLIKYLDYLEEVGAKGADFVADQAPETVRQFVQWEIVYHSIAAAACVCICGAMLFGFYKSLKLMQKHEAWECSPIMVLFILVILPSIGAWTNGTTALKAYIAPNVFLIEKAAELIK